MIKIDRKFCPYPKALKNKNYKHPTNKQALKESNSDKCMYCESKISHIDYAHVEHIKPKSKYQNLEFDWNNLGYACPKCNVEKNDKYYEDLPYINPYEEEPADFFYAFGKMLFKKDGSERAEITIKDINLNRPELLEKRFEKINSIERAITSCYRIKNASYRKVMLDELKNEASKDKEYSLFIKSFFKHHNLEE
ncbi:HNH endonuclease [Pseudofrancisella aestuarii]|uniref:HNH endonuclease n=1 Tax=Pseudofrancisella aestuarii TaxID=2670347 RepID=A0ABV9TAR6_9GAMM|nr:HNH endonuclease [Pseudofrancisella aestuarii]